MQKWLRSSSYALFFSFIAAIVAVPFLHNGPALAQFDDEPVCIITTADALSDGNADLIPAFSIAFTEEGATLELPDSEIVLSCRSTAEEIVEMAVSPSVEFMGIMPMPTNDDDAIEGRPGYAIVNTSFANLRTGPGTQYTQVAVVRGATELIVLGHNPLQTWWYVQVGDIRGWIANSIVVVRGDLTDVPIVQTEGEIIQPRLYVGFTGNPLYNEVSPSADVICELEGRTEFLVLGRNLNGNWYYIEGRCLNGRTAEGWINADLGALRNPGGVRLDVLPSSPLSNR